MLDVLGGALALGGLWLVAALAVLSLLYATGERERDGRPASGSATRSQRRTR